jgi:hypothetical protein
VSIPNHIPDAFLGSGDKTENHTDKNTCSKAVYILLELGNNEEQIYIMLEDDAKIKNKMRRSRI